MKADHKRCVVTERILARLGKGLIGRIERNGVCLVGGLLVVIYLLVALQQVRGFSPRHGGHRRACGRKCSR